MNDRKLPIKKKTICCILLLFVGSVFYFAPKPMKDLLKADSTTLDSGIYCSYLYTIHQPQTQNFSGKLGLDQQDTLNQLLEVVTLSGPVLQKNGAINAQELNLFFAMKDGTGYRHLTMCFILENGINLFVNVDNGGQFSRGYFVTGGGAQLVELMQGLEHAS